MFSTSNMESDFEQNRAMDIYSAHNDETDESEWARPLSQDKMKTTFRTESDFAIACKTSTPKTEHGRTIIHFDVDCFYAQVEMLRNPELRNKPLGIQQKSLVVTTNYVARGCGVPKSTSVTEAKKICPGLVLVCGEDLTNYRQMSYRISEFLQKYTSSVERLGFDENFLDVSELVTMRLRDNQYKEEFVGHVYGSDKQGLNKPRCSCGCHLRLQIGSQIAAEIRDALEKELGITCCAGVSYNKLLSKLVAGTHKPSQQTTLLPNLALELMSSLTSVLGIPGIGYKTTSRLESHRVSSVQDLQTSDRDLLEREFGPQFAQLMVQLSFGVDESPVVAFSQPQTLSDEDSFKCCNEAKDAECRIRDLLASLLQRVVEDGRTPQTVRLTVRRAMNKYHRESKQCPIPANTFTKCLQDYTSEAVVERLMLLLMSLFCKLVDTSQPFHLTLIGVSFAKLMKLAHDIGTFFSRAEPVSQQVSCNRDLNEKVTAACVNLSPTTKSAPLKLDTKTKPSARTKTIQHFFLKTSNEAGGRHQSVGSASEHLTSIDISLFAEGVKGRLANNDPTDNTSVLIDRTGHWSASEQELKAITTAFPDPGLADSSSCTPNELSRSGTDLELNTSEETSLQSLLPAGFDAHTIAELPVDIQNEIFLQYGIYAEELPQGRRFSKISGRIRTRSNKAQEQTTVSGKRDQQISRDTNSTTCSKTTASIAKKRKALFSEGDQGVRSKRGLHLTVAEDEEYSANINHKNLSTGYASNDTNFVATSLEGKQCSCDVLTSMDHCIVEDSLGDVCVMEKEDSRGDNYVMEKEDSRGDNYVMEKEDSHGDNCVMEKEDSHGDNCVMEKEDSHGDNCVMEKEDSLGNKCVMEKEDSLGNKCVIEKLRSNSDNVFSCVSHDQCRHTASVKYDGYSESVKTISEQKEPEISTAKHQGPSLKKSVTGPQPSQTSIESCDHKGPQPHQTSIESLDHHGPQPPQTWMESRHNQGPQPPQTWIESRDHQGPQPPQTWIESHHHQGPQPPQTWIESHHHQGPQPPQTWIESHHQGPQPPQTWIESHHQGPQPPQTWIESHHQGPQPPQKSIESRDHQGSQPPQTWIQSHNIQALSSRGKVSQQKLPSNIDSEVFLSLPSNIRGEIMAHIVMGTSASTSGQNVRNVVGENKRNVKQIKNKGQNSLLTYFNRSDSAPKKM